MSELNGEVLGAGSELGRKEPVLEQAECDQGGQERRSREDSASDDEARRDDSKDERRVDQPWAKTSSGDKEHVAQESD
jgi:hypothetical protein